jgi:hypothetical protein
MEACGHLLLPDRGSEESAQQAIEWIRGPEPIAFKYLGPPAAHDDRAVWPGYAALAMHETMGQRAEEPPPCPAAKG